MKWFLALLLLVAPANAQVTGQYPAFPYPLTTGDCIKALNTFQGQDAGGPCAISGGTGSFTTLTASSTVTFNMANANFSLAPTGTGTATINPATAGTINNMSIGVSTPLPGNFTTIGASTRGTLAATTGNFNNTLTFADTSTWASTGISDGASYTTGDTTPPINFGITNSYSSTSNGVSGFSFGSTMTSTGASSGNVLGASSSATIGASANNIATATGWRFGLTEGAGYSGTISSGSTINVIGPTISGTNPITGYQGINIAASANGNGITTGSVSNYGINIAATTAAAGVGGTVSNAGINLIVPSASSAGTSNFGIQISGNGGASAAVNKAINSTSTAPSTFAGPLLTSGSIPTIASGACGTGSNGTLTTGSRTNSGQVNIGAAATTTCTVVFAVALPTAPFCVISASDAAAIGATALPYVSANTVNGFVITGAVLANASFNYICL